MEPLISAPRLMGSRGGGAGDAIGKVETGQPEPNSLVILSSAESCSQRGKMSAARASEPAFLFKVPDTQRFIPNGGDSCSTKDQKRGNGPGSDGKELNQRSGKAARGSGSGSTKRSRMLQLALSVNEPCVEDIKSNLPGDGLSPTKCVAAEKCQTNKQKNSSNVKRSDKRCGRPPKSRSDSFCLKSGLLRFSAITGGNSFLATYASKSDVFNGTKPVDDLPLDKLLDGSYERPSLVTDKGKYVQDSKDNLVNSVRKACTLLHLDRPIPTFSFLEVDSMYARKVSMDPFSTVGGSASRVKLDSPTINEKPSIKDSFWNVKSPACAINSPLVSPTDVLERLALPPSEELDSLLLDAMKPASSSRSATELRVGKTISHRNGLPPFNWSLNSSANAKYGSDTSKISASKTACPGRWVKVGNTPTPSEGSNHASVDLKSLKYDPRLVPVGSHSASRDAENAFSKYLRVPSFELPLTTGSVSKSPTEEHSPGLLAAAEMLCEVSSLQYSNQSSRETRKSQKKSSQKETESRKSKSTQKYDLLEAAPRASTDPEHLFKVPDGIFSSKKIKLSVDEKRDPVPRKDPINWYPPRSIRQSPMKSLNQESVVDSKHYNNNVVKRSTMMPPPSRVVDKAYNSKQKLKHIGSVNGNQAARKLDS